MSESTMPGDHRERRVREAMAEDLRAADAGQAPDHGTPLARSPDLRAELEESLADQDAMARMAAHPRPVDAVAEAPDPTTLSLPGDHSPALDTTDERDPTQDAVTATMPPGDTDPGSQPGILPGATRVRYFGDYEIHGELGRGGMGIVYRARQGEPQPTRRPQDHPGRGPGR